MRIESFSFGSIQIDGHSYDHDVVIEAGRIHKRNKGASKHHRETFGHTPLSLDERIPWECRRLIVGTGAAGALPIMDEVKEEARQRGVELVTIPTEEAIRALSHAGRGTNAILHVTC